MSEKLPTLADVVADLVFRRPRTGFEIARALEARLGLSVRGREGALYAALLQLERDGGIEGIRGRDGKTRYQLPVLRDVRIAAGPGGAR
jgi:DNA-binding PadR family transcriptional regulator